MDEKPPRRRINWRNVAFVVLLGSPLWYVGDQYLPHYGGPAVTSPEGRAILRGYLRTFFPELVSHQHKGPSR